MKLHWFTRTRAAKLTAIVATLVAMAAIVASSAVFTYRHAAGPPASMRPPTTLAAEFTQLENAPQPDPHVFPPTGPGQASYGERPGISGRERNRTRDTRRARLSGNVVLFRELRAARLLERIRQRQQRTAIRIGARSCSLQHGRGRELRSEKYSELPHAMCRGWLEPLGQVHGRERHRRVSLVGILQSVNMIRRSTRFACVESDAGRVIEIYQRHAAAWSADRGDRLIEKAWLDRLLALLPQDSTVLDLGCGCGVPIARYLIEQHRCRVTGVDAASAMIAMCEGFPEGEWLVADMRTLALNRTFSGIIAWDSFFHLSQADQRRMFAIFKRHAASAAALMFTSGPSAGEQMGTYRGEPLYHASLDSSEYRQLLHDHGFDVVTHVVADPDCGLHTVWLAQAAG